ncbi:MAG: tyrosine-type recombinase/integrase [Bacteroidetes bacterium]|nr:tyrosine-type recombinase/integrase [Bacteroidota bacterium]
MNYSQNIFRFAVITGRLENNPARELSIALKPRQTTHFPTIKSRSTKDFLKSVEVANTSIQNKIALKLQLITFLRSSELRKSKWECINFENKRWLVPAELMKMKQPHVVPLSEYAISLLKELSTITGDNLYLFPNNQHKSIHI